MGFFRGGPEFSLRSLLFRSLRPITLQLASHSGGDQGQSLTPEEMERLNKIAQRKSGEPVNPIRPEEKHEFPPDPWGAAHRRLTEETARSRDRERQREEDEGQQWVRRLLQRDAPEENDLSIDQARKNLRKREEGLEE